MTTPDPVLAAHPTPWTVQVANEYGDPMIVDAEGCEVLECSEVGCTIFDIIAAAVNAYTRPPSGDDVEGPWVTREQIGELHDAFTTCLHTNRRCACTFWSDMDPEQQDEFVEMTRKVGIEVRDDVEGR